MSKSRLAVSEPVRDFSGFGVGSLLTTVFALIEPWYSPATAGMRTARPTGPMKVRRSVGEDYSAAFAAAARFL